MKHVIGNIIQKSQKLHGLKGKCDGKGTFDFMKYINEIRKIKRMRASVNMCMRDRRKTQNNIGKYLQCYQYPMER